VRLLTSQRRLFRITQQLCGGGFIAVTGEPGTGKSAVLRIVAWRLQATCKPVTSFAAHPATQARHRLRRQLSVDADSASSAGCSVRVRCPLSVRTLGSGITSGRSFAAEARTPP
jgi:ABC-type iron transport system FetAB ATPase subunit